MPTPRKHADRAERQRAYRERQKSARIAEIQSKGLPVHAPIPTMPSKARWRALVLAAADLLRAAQEEMESYQGDRSESWHESEKGEAFQETVELLEEARDLVEAAL